MIQRFKHKIKYILLCNEYEDNYIKKIVNILVGLFGNYRNLYFIELIVTTKCNLRCKECSNLIPYVQKNSRIFNYREVVEMIDNLMKQFDVIYNLQLQGGEPLLNQELPLIVNHLLTYKERIKNIWIISNGTIIPSMDLINAIKNTKVTFTVSNYEFNESRSHKIAAICSEHNAHFRRRKTNLWHKFYLVNNPQEHSLIKQDLIKKRHSCPMRNCPSILNNKLYLCSRLANMINIIPNIVDDGISLSDESIKVAHILMNKEYSENCKYCMFDTNHRCKPGEQLE